MGAGPTGRSGNARGQHLDTPLVSAALLGAAGGRRLAMKILQVSVLVFAAALGGTARAQLPLPLPGEPGPDLSRRPQCTSAYVRSVEQQVAAMRKLRSAGPEAVSQLCTLIELGGAWLGGELPEDLRMQLKEKL